MKSALILGASGATGSCLLQEILQSDRYAKVFVYVRKPLPIQHSKLEQLVVDFDHLQTTVPADDVFCCLGTTIKKAGSEAAFEKVDYQYPLQIAQLQRAAGSSSFLVITAMGAKASSAIFYNQVKGKLEDSLRQLTYPTLYIFRPSLIVSNRQEHRVGEKIAIALFQYLNYVLPKHLQSVQATAIAKCMLHHANEATKGQHIIKSNTIKAFE